MFIGRSESHPYGLSFGGAEFNSSLNAAGRYRSSERRQRGICSQINILPLRGKTLLHFPNVLKH
jgi:hypothetical protein